MSYGGGSKSELSPQSAPKCPPDASEQPNADAALPPDAAARTPPNAATTRQCARPAALDASKPGAKRGATLSFLSSEKLKVTRFATL